MQIATAGLDDRTHLEDRQIHRDDQAADHRITSYNVCYTKLLRPALFQGRAGPDKGCYLYGRHFNPTVYNLSRQLAALEGTELAYCTASGMAAISGTLFQLCDSGDHIVSANTVYGGTYALLHDFLPAKAGITTTLVDIIV